MISPSEAAILLEKYRQNLGIPAQAKLSFLEKRSIELAANGEIEAVVPMSAPMEDIEAEIEEEAPLPESAELPHPGYTEKICWVGRYTQAFLFWDLSIDESGTLVRLRKSR